MKIKPVTQVETDDYCIMLDKSQAYYKNITKEIYLFPYNANTKTHLNAYLSVAIKHCNKVTVFSQVKEQTYAIGVNNFIEECPKAEGDLGVDFKVGKSTKYKGYKKYTITADITSVNSDISLNIGSRIEINSDGENTFTIRDDNRYYAVFTIVTMDSKTPMVRVYDITDLPWWQFTIEEFIKNKDYVASLAFDYDAEPDDKFLLYNSLYSTYNSKVYDKDGIEIHNYKKLPMMTYTYDLNNFMEYARFEDITPWIENNKYHYFNDMGLSGDITDNAEYTIMYNHHPIIKIGYSPTGYDVLWWTKYTLEYFEGKYKRATAEAYENCTKLAKRVFREDDDNVDAFVIDKDTYAICTPSGSVIATNDFKYALVISKGKKTAAYDRQYSICLNDYDKETTPFRIGIGMKEMPTDFGTYLNISTVSDILVSPRIGKYLSVMNTNIIYKAAEDNTANRSFLGRTYVGPEGSIHLMGMVDDNDSVSEFGISKLDSIFYKITDKNKVMFIRDMFGMPTPIVVS